MTSLKLWVSNQPAGAMADMTRAYLDSCGWTPPKGCSLHGCWLTGPDDTVADAFADLKDAVAGTGHGQDFEDADPPELVVEEEHYIRYVRSCYALEPGAAEFDQALIEELPYDVVDRLDYVWDAPVPPADRWDEEIAEFSRHLETL